MAWYWWVLIIIVVLFVLAKSGLLGDAVEGLVDNIDLGGGDSSGNWGDD